MSDSEEEIQERQLKIVLLGDGASGKRLAAEILGIKLNKAEMEQSQRIVKAELVDYPQDEGPIRQDNNPSKICSVQ